MTTYRVLFVSPVASNKWEATTFERNIEAENFNYMLMKALTPDDIKYGVRILKVEVYNNIKGEWQKI